MASVRLLLVDDHLLFRKGLASLLAQEKDIEVVAEAGTGQEALEKISQHMPDVVLLDIFMPGSNGLELTRTIKQEFPYVKVVILTVSEEEHHLFEAIKAGAQGYLTKGISPGELVEMIRGINLGEAPISRKTAAKLLESYARQSREPSLLSVLSKREREVLELVAKGLSNRQIGESLFISEQTVKNHLRNILEKLHLENRVQAAVMALKEGLNRPDFTLP